MAETEARIRAYNDSEQDQKRFRFYIGKSEMEGLTAANVKMYMNPFVLALWIGLSSVFVQFMGWWPKEEQGPLSYFSPIPAFLAMWMPIMFGCDWLNRDDFEKGMNKALRRRDLIKIKDYYARSPASAIFFLEYGDRFVGQIAVDASPDSSNNDVIATADSKAKVSFTKGTSDVATIRHFFVDEPYRVANMQTDLLQFAVRHVFESNTKVKTLKAVDSPLVPYAGKVLRQEGFKQQGVLDKVGVLRWTRKVMVLERKVWEQRQKKGN